MHTHAPRFPVIAFNQHDGGWWFRVLGYGLRGKNLHRWPHIDQNILVIGHWSFSFITP